MNMKDAYRLSTHYLTIFSALYCAAIGWILSDPAHLKTVNDAMHGHAALVALFNGAMLLFNLLHSPKTTKMIAGFAANLMADEPETGVGASAGNAGPSDGQSFPPRKPPQPVQYAPEEAWPQPPEQG